MFSQRRSFRFRCMRCAERLLRRIICFVYAKMGKKGGHGHAPGTGPRRRFGGDGKPRGGYDYSKDNNDPTWPYARGQMDRTGWAVVILFPLLVFSSIGYYWYQGMMRESVRKPLDAPNIISANATSALVDPERFWGTYRPGVYFGMKTRSPHSPVFGLMWMTELTGQLPPPLRHWCEQNDRLTMYSWFAHDGVNFGFQEIVDNYQTVSTEFVKRPGGEHGGDWTARIRANARPGAEHVVMSFFFYAALDGQGELEGQFGDDGKLNAVRGYSEELGHFKLSFPKAENVHKHHFLATHAEGLEHLTETTMAGFRVANWGKSGKGRDQSQYLALGGKVMTVDHTGKKMNFIVKQVTVSLPFTMEVMFESGSFKNRPSPLKSDVFQNELNHAIGAFSEKFEATFGLEKKGFSQTDIGYAKAALSNMLGGIGYFYGHSLVSSPYTDKGPLQYWDAPLYTAVPSRSFFPRGFLWDEGFHNLLISEWDPHLSKDIIGHWLDLMNNDGWIPREQILGPEARAKVPDEFVVQYNQNANPPTLILPLQRIVKQLIESDEPEDKQYLKNLYPRLKQWYTWFNTTQTGPKASSYRWRGRDGKTVRELNPKTLTSGLDDYPRSSHPTDDEYHVDLRCWMALASGLMADIAKSLGEPWEEYDATHHMLSDNVLLDQLHWSDKGHMYADYGLNTHHVRLERPPPPPDRGPGRPPPPQQDKVRVVKKKPTYQHVEQFGYISLFPFLLKIIDHDSPKLGRILSDLHDPNLLWTKYGLRSLAKTASMYNKHNTEHDPPYWRGNIWINMNYLAVGALHHYSSMPGPHQETAASLYTELRQNLIDNIIGQFKKTGYIWENYSDTTGEGRGCHPFTGWSALVVTIMAEKY